MLRMAVLALVCAVSAVGAAQAVAAFDPNRHLASLTTETVQAPIEAAATGEPAQIAKAADGHYWAEASVNGSRVRFLVDTEGAQRVMCGSNFAGWDQESGVVARVKGLGLDKDWAYRIIKQVGNYGESYERNVGPNTPLAIPRDGSLNALWNKGGLMYTPPFR